MRRLHKILIGTLLSGVAVLSVGIVKVIYGPGRGVRATSSPAIEISQSDLLVACLGYIEPEDGVIRVAARSISGQPSIIGKLLVKEGDTVEAGQIVAVLDSNDQLKAFLRQAEAQITVARSRVAQVKAGAKPAEIAAQRAEVARIESELLNAQMEYRRYQKLREKDVVSASALDSSRLLVETKAQILVEASERLAGLSQVRQVDVDLATAEVEAAVAEERRARAEFNLSQIRAPFGGRIIKIHAWPGEEVGAEGILELGRTSRMYVIAEVLETDVPRLRIGQTAVITGAALPRSLQGAVEQIGLNVAKSRILSADPAAYTDSRVVEVKIRLNDSRRAEGLVNAQVNVSISIQQ